MHPASGALIGRQTGLNGATNQHVVLCLKRIEDALANVIAFGENTHACLDNQEILNRAEEKGVYSIIHRPTLIPDQSSQ